MNLLTLVVLNAAKTVRGDFFHNIFPSCIHPLCIHVGRGANNNRVSILRFPCNMTLGKNHNICLFIDDVFSGGDAHVQTVPVRDIMLRWCV